MKKLIMGLIIITAVMLLSATANAKTLTRYTTRTVSLKTYSKRTVYRVPRNTRLTQISAGRVWSKVKYKNRVLWVHTKWLHELRATKKYTGSYFRRAGAIHWGGKKYTWYSQMVLPGYGLKIPGRHLDSQGFVCDNNGYIVLGSNTANRGRIIATPFGKHGKVYDAGYVGTYWFDCYVGW